MEEKKQGLSGDGMTTMTTLRAIRKNGETVLDEVLTLYNPSTGQFYMSNIAEDVGHKLNNGWEGA